MARSLREVLPCRHGVPLRDWCHRCDDPRDYAPTYWQRLCDQPATPAVVEACALCLQPTVNPSGLCDSCRSVVREEEARDDLDREMT